MTNVEKKLAQSLSSETTELIPYLPYLLQDLFELGSSPKDMLEIIQKKIPTNKPLRILDLACGKGAVSIHLAKFIPCTIKGIDIMKDFIEVGRSVSKENNLDRICSFEINDINESVLIEKDYDIVILGAVGSVLGSPKETLEKLSKTIKLSGYILLDDGYAKEEQPELYFTKSQWLKTIESCGLKLIDEKYFDDSEFKGALDEQIRVISKRVNELKERHLEHAHLFDGYLQSQLDEIEDLTTDVIGVTLFLKRLP